MSTDSDNNSDPSITIKNGHLKAAELFLQKGHTTQFITDSSYLGSWNHIGVTVAGIYRFPDGMLYEGRLRDGQFDGCGTLSFPQGHVIIGHWVKGIVKSMSFVFADGLKFNESNWTYCTDGDRRYCTNFDFSKYVSNKIKYFLGMLGMN